jgi:hypothetical protein
MGTIERTHDGTSGAGSIVLGLISSMKSNASEQGVFVERYVEN